MPQFQDYLMRHGEFGVQTLIEQIERVEGIRNIKIVSLEERWGALMQAQDDQHDMAA